MLICAEKWYLTGWTLQDHFVEPKHASFRFFQVTKPNARGDHSKGSNVFPVIGFINRSNCNMALDLPASLRSHTHQAASNITAWLMEYKMRSACLCTLPSVKHTHVRARIFLHGRLAAHKSHPPKRISRNNLSREGFYFIVCQPPYVPAACADPRSDKFACHLSWAVGIWACVIM